jgi:hypothetical protein
LISEAGSVIDQQSANSLTTMVRVRADRTTGPAPDRPLSALPSVGVRVGAFTAICLSGLAGALIGYSLVDLQCDGSCAVPSGIGLLTGAVVAAAGMAIVAVLVMRALGEWRESTDRERAGHAPTETF